ncbi:cytochrome c3 family protein [Photobacterium alginatilyticum]|uniref:Cytochrome c-type protein n=1 Tax=Photobacterium alginatilyticum TaxID=1775171 RepID=A0ABW9YDS9_9GAMM|nr:NapC/NirT family cytochrome c [Photobacterium alginatilyticum]NBI51349.1 cytochrome C [Photobacterium alginatilyticum]
MNRKWFIVILLAIGGLLGTGASLVTAEIAHSTGDAAFCGSCHSMEPMANTFKLDVHGGNNNHGFVAQCVDCHLPQDSVFGYMVDKTKHGINDVFVENFTNTDEIDWIARREERERFVFDSGCLNCHQALLDRQEAENPKSLQTHAHYKNQLASGDPIQCVSCHVTVGHNGMLRSELNKRYPEYSFESK